MTARVWLSTIIAGLAGAACGSPPEKLGVDAGIYTEEREPCADYDPQRKAFYGETHLHTALSFDAYTWSTRVTPEEAYAFMKGDPVLIPPLDQNGQPTQEVRLRRALDFGAVTDHAEFLGEVASCIDPENPAYDMPICVAMREGADLATIRLGGELLGFEPQRIDEICPDNEACGALARPVWDRIVAATDAAYDRTAACTFTAFHGYEWSGNPLGRNLHRNVLFRNGAVPPLPVSYFDAPVPEDFWDRLDTACGAVEGCEALAIPHNSNLSNGAMFQPLDPALSDAEQRDLAEQRARVEPIVEIFQHKGNSECINGISGVVGGPDELCEIEQLRTAEDDCGDGLGTVGITGGGCTSRRDFVRNALLLGMQEWERIGINPLRLGIIAATDTHNGTGGATDEADWRGHIGSYEDTAAERLGEGFEQPSGILGNPGGLAGVWAEENSRDAIFLAMKRRETFGTSGTFIAPRLFGGWDYPDDICADPDLVGIGYADGVPMGARLPRRPSGAGAPVFVLSGIRDPDDGAAPLQIAQIVKGWVAADGTLHWQVHDVAGDPDNGATVDEATCEPTGTGAATLCGTWRDPDFDPDRPAYYYARFVENPTCRWSWRQCLDFAPGSRPPGCDNPDIPRTTQEMAWTSPIWYEP